MESTIYWNDAKSTEPIEMQTILVIYDNCMWLAVYANGEVSLYPEDFGSVRLIDCDLWAAKPEVPQY
jgi:hypothetical protein